MMGGASVETTGFNPCREKRKMSGWNCVWTSEQPFKEQAMLSGIEEAVIQLPKREGVPPNPH